jgi:uncharacterized OsmC-like protein
VVSKTILTYIYIKILDNVDESELDKMLEQALKNYKPIFDSTAEVVEVEAEAEVEEIKE